jgi:16S rRNA (guanine527-N7)-methyltransferase
MSQTLSLFENGCLSLGVRLSESQSTKFQRYFEQLIEWNGYFNLTSITENKQVQTKHFLDSMSLIISGLEFEDKSLLDVGSGAGFPGIPLKILFPSLKLTLLEASSKKCHFLEHVTNILELNEVKVCNERAEVQAHQPEFRENFDLVAARALASLDVLVELCLPFCAIGGHFVAMKSGSEQELHDAGNSLATMGGKISQDIEVNLPGISETRHLIIIDKISRTPAKYPRRPGIPRKRPVR